VDIHPPHGAAHSWKDFLIQLGTITAGVLIALSFEGAREWRHERTLVREARETITRELADNSKELDGVLADMSERRKSLQAALQFADDRLAAKKTDIHELKLSSSLADLSTSSWQTAERTNALAHMDYAEVQTYSRVYNAQELYAGQQRKSVELIAAASAFVLGGGDPNIAPVKDIEEFRQRLLTLIGETGIEEQFGRQLAAAYAKARRQE
jgi:hypothetical protein